MLEAIGWLGSAWGIAGAIMNAQRMRSGFLFYVVANIAMIYVGVVKQEWYNVCLFAVFSIIAVYGYISWGRKTDRGTCGHQ